MPYHDDPRLIELATLIPEIVAQLDLIPECRAGICYQLMLQSTVAPLLLALGMHTEEAERQLITYADLDHITPAERTAALDLVEALPHVITDVRTLLSAEHWGLVFPLLTAIAQGVIHHEDLARELLRHNHFAHDERYAAFRRFMKLEDTPNEAA